MVKTSAGKPWAEVTWLEAMGMVMQWQGLVELMTYEEMKSPEMQAIIDDGLLAEALLGPLNVHTTIKSRRHDNL